MLGFGSKLFLSFWSISFRIYFTKISESTPNITWPLVLLYNYCYGIVFFHFVPYTNTNIFVFSFSFFNPPLRFRLSSRMVSPSQTKEIGKTHAIRLDILSRRQIPRRRRRRRDPVSILSPWKNHHTVRLLLLRQATADHRSVENPEAALRSWLKGQSENAARRLCLLQEQLQHGSHVLAVLQESQNQVRRPDHYESEHQRSDAEESDAQPRAGIFWKRRRRRCDVVQRGGLGLMCGAGAGFWFVCVEFSLIRMFGFNKYKYKYFHYN